METARGRAQRRHVREKATIDHLVRDVYEPKTPDEKHTEHRPTTSTGLPVEDQVRKEWKAALARIPRFFGVKLPDHVRNGITNARDAEPPATTQATPRSQCGDQRDGRDRYRWLRGDRLHIRGSGSPGRAHAGRTMRPGSHALDERSPRHHRAHCH